METIEIYTKAWTIVTRINMSFHDTEYQQIQDVVQNMFTLCELVNNVDSYDLYALLPLAPNLCKNWKKL